MKISKHFDERPNLRVSTTFQKQVLKEMGYDDYSIKRFFESARGDSTTLTKTLKRKIIKYPSLFNDN